MKDNDAEIKPWDPPSVRARKLGMTGPFTPAEWLLIAGQPIGPSHPDIDARNAYINTDPVVVAAEKPWDNAKRRHDEATSRWHDAIVNVETAKIAAQGEALANGAFRPASIELQAAVRRLEAERLVAEDERDEAGHALMKASVSRHDSRIVAGARYDAQHKPPTAAPEPEPIRAVRMAVVNGPNGRRTRRQDEV